MGSGVAVSWGGGLERDVERGGVGWKVRGWGLRFRERKGDEALEFRV